MDGHSRNYPGVTQIQRDRYGMYSFVCRYQLLNQQNHRIYRQIQLLEEQIALPREEKQSYGQMGVETRMGGSSRAVRREDQEDGERQQRLWSI